MRTRKPIIDHPAALLPAHGVNLDELNCPACPAQTMMEVIDYWSEDCAEGVEITCPTCHFTVSHPSGPVAEMAIRMLQVALRQEIEQEAQET